MSDFASWWFSDDFLQSLEVAFPRKESVDVPHWFSDDVSHRLPDEFVQRLSDVFVRTLPDDVLQWHLNAFLQRHTDDVSRKHSSDFLWWLLCFFFRKEAGVLSRNEPRVFSPYSWDREDRKSESSDVLKKLDEDLQKRAEDSRKCREASRKRKAATRKRLDYFLQWFSDDFWQRFLDALLQRPSDSILPWLSDIAKGDEDAVRKLCVDYFPMMVSFAQRKFETGIPVLIADEEDAAIETMYEFYEGMVERKFDIGTEGKLRGLLYKITKGRVVYWKRHIATQKRGSGRVLILKEPKTKKRLTFATIAALGIEAKDEGKQGGLASIPDKKQRTPEEELIAAEKFFLGAECQQMVEQLPNEELRQIATLMIDGSSSTAIASTLKCTDQTIRNKRDKIRDKLLVKLMGTEPTPQRANEAVKKYQSLLDELDADRRTIAESWLKGDKPQEIAKKLGRSSTAIYNELLRIARIWENS